jgi:putative signal transducing protein
MTDERESLAETFRAFSDEYLLERLRSGDLTELACSVAVAELAQRGIAAAPPARREVDRAAQEDSGPVEFVTVARFLVPTYAHIIRGRLEADGIPAVVADGNFAQNNTLVSVAAGGVRLQVPAAFAAEAREIIAAIRSGGLALDDDAWKAAEKD